MTIINTFFYASLAYSICLYLIPTHGSLLVVTIVSTCLTLGFRFFGLRVMTPFIAICLFFTRHIHCKDSRCLSSMIAYLCRSGPSFAGRSEFLGNIFVHTRFHGGIPGMSCRGQEGFIAQGTLSLGSHHSACQVDVCVGCFPFAVCCLLYDPHI